jgi:molecular chaperone GrpE
MTKKIDKNLELENKLKRALADYQNLVKRVNEEKSEFVKFFSRELILKLLPVFDDLQRSQQHLNDAGLNLIIAKFKTVLESEGVAELNLANTIFDPKTAEVSELINGKKDYIIEIVQPGYTLNGRVLRPARVKVGKGDSICPTK